MTTLKADSIRSNSFKYVSHELESAMINIQWENGKPDNKCHVIELNLGCDDIFSHIQTSLRRWHDGIEDCCLSMSIV